MYKLYWHPGTCSLAPMAILEELSIPYESHKVDYDGGECQTLPYLGIHPLGLIPALELEHGESMFESAAIVQFLCDKHGGTDLAPSVAEPGRAGFLQWLHFISNTLYPSYNRIAWPDRYTSSAGGAEGVKTRASQTVLKQWQVVEDSLSKTGPWLLGSRFSACDIYMQMVTTWHESPAGLLKTFPHVHELARGVAEREACSAAIRRHNATTGLEDGQDFELVEKHS